MVPIIERETVSRGWLKEEEFPDIIALAQSGPGLLAVNMAIFAGYKIRGTLGSIVATIGATLPSFLMILAIAIAFTGFKDSALVISAFQGIRPVVVALIVVPMVNMARKNNHSWWTWLLTLSSLFAVAFLKFSPVYILIVVMVVSVAIAWYREGHRK